MAGRAKQIAGFVARHVAHALWVSLMVLTPLLGFWLASSLAAYHNATQWLSLLVGLLLFPILPVGWELFHVWRRKRREDARPQILTRLDRLVLRTLIVNGLFLGGMMWQARAQSFRALAVRGDWMLDGYSGPVAQTVRGWLLGLADRLDKRRSTSHHSYGESDDAPDDVRPPDPVKPRIPEPTETQQTPDAPPTAPGGWPLSVDPHPLVATLTEGDEASIDSVARFLSSRIADKRELAKALHDYVVGRLHYDYDALKRIEAKDYANTPSQEAEAVFTRRAAVCEGYARLMVALGKAADVEIAYVTGSIRDSERRLATTDDPWDTSLQDALEGVGHAWNAVKLDGQWYLMDVTWDDPTNGTPQTTYLFTPPHLMAFDHYPDDPKWQLLPSPLSLGEFVRQPLLSPAIGEFGLSLTSPTRSQITVSGEATIVLDNPYGAAVAARWVRDGSSKDEKGERCDVTSGKQTKIRCNLPDGEFEIRMFAAPKSRVKVGTYTLDYVGSILVNSH
jgi:transglutaminase-like putative cysteine protease